LDHEEPLKKRPLWQQVWFIATAAIAISVVATVLLYGDHLGWFGVTQHVTRIIVEPPSIQTQQAQDCLASGKACLLT
jgi:hypothetical protein